MHIVNVTGPVPINDLEKLGEPSSSYWPSPAACVDGDDCNHHGKCPRIWIKQDFLLRPEVYSDYWSLDKDDLGRFIVKSNHAIGKPDDTPFEVQEYRTFVWRVTNITSAMEENPEETLWMAVWVD